MSDSCALFRGLRPSRVVAGACLVTALLAPSVRAQDEPSPLRVEILSGIFSDLPPMAGVQLVTTGGGVEEGSLERVGADGIEVLTDGMSHAIGYDRIRAVSVRGGHGLQGALWGAGGGALAGAFFGMMFSAFDCQSSLQCANQETSGAWTWGAAMGAVGGGIGFYFGRRERHWHPIFP